MEINKYTEERGDFMHKTSKWIQILLAVSIIMSYPMIFLAADSPAQVDFVASIPDANDNFTVTMSISNATFNAFQFVLRYDVTKIQPIDANTKTATTNFSGFSRVNSQISNSFSSLDLRLDTVLGLIDFTQYITPGQTFSYLAETIENAANIGSTPLQFFVFHFKLLSSDAPMLELAKQDTNKNYRDYLPNGGGLAKAGVQLSSLINIDLTHLEGEIIVEEYVNPTPPPITPPVTPTDPPEEEQTTQRPKTATERLVNTLVMQIGNYAAADQGALCHIYPGEKEVTPYIREQRTFVPIRFIAEKLGMEVNWNDTNRTVTFTKGDEILKLTIGEYRYLQNGHYFSMDTAAEIQWNRTMVPVRFVAEALGYAVEWNSTLKMVFITETTVPWLLDEPVEEQATNDVAFVISPLLRDFV
jgi:hypothetical protein